jgi:hypothetical protein
VRRNPYSSGVSSAGARCCYDSILSEDDTVPDLKVNASASAMSPSKCICRNSGLIDQQATAPDNHGPSPGAAGIYPSILSQAHRLSGRDRYRAPAPSTETITADLSSSC